MTFQLLEGRWGRRVQYGRLALDRLRQPKARAMAVVPAVTLNPYLSLIYSGWTQPVLGTDVGTAARLAKLGLIRGVHLHWDEFLFPFARPTVTKASQIALEGIGSRGKRIAFTIHNDLPHSDLDNPDAIAHFRQWRQYVLDRSDVVHVHSSSARDRILSEYDVTPGRLHVVPHPSYAGVFSPVPRPSVPLDRRRFLGFGTIRRNKGIPNLISAFRQIDIPDRQIELCLAGRGAEAFEEADLGANRLILSSGFVADADVPALFADTEFCVFGFDSALTSGSLMLALTLGKPVIVPRFGALMEVFDDAFAPLSYTPGDVDELAAVLTRAAALDAHEIVALGEQSLSLAKRYDPSGISRRLSEVITGT